MADNQQQIDHYDFINAPQFVDFDDLAAHDDPQADKFFETHREEDDFMIPLDINNISPTVQLLYNTENGDEENDSDDNEHYSNEANKAAMAAGLEDVKIEYYASPQNHSVKSQSLPSSASKKTSISNSMYGTPLGPLGGSGYSSAADSFRTPTGGEDKENMTPAPSSVKKLLKSEPFQIKAGGKGEVIEENNSQRVILSERSVGVGGNLSTSTNTPGHTETESLYAKLDKLLIVSSDEEDATEDTSYFTGNVQQNALPETAQEVEATDPSTTYSTFNENKLSFLGLSGENNQPDNSDNDSSSEQGDVTLICQSSGKAHEHQDIPISPIPHEIPSSDSEEEVDNNESAPMELGTPVRNILKKLDAELHLELEPQEAENEQRYSILVAPSVGRQVHWNHEGESIQQHIQMSNALAGRELNISYKVDDAPVPAPAHLNEHTLTYGSDSDSEDEFYGIFEAAVTSSLVPARRASSVGDLVSLMEPKARDFTTYGYNPRVGITIPKTPESESADVQQEQRPGPSTLESFSSNMNSCYFEIEPPKPSKSMRRVSSCSDLLKVQEIKTKPVASRKPVQKRLPTIPRTPEALKRSQKGGQRSILPSASSSKNESIIGRKKEVGPSVAHRLAATSQPMKANHYVSMAEAMINYQKNTPDRFRSLPRGRTVPEKRSASSDSRKRFTPSPAHSPESTSRANLSYNRPKTAGNNGPVLPKRVELKPTIPKPFNFGSTHKHKPAVVKEDTVDFKFKARPAPSGPSKTLHELAAPKGRPAMKVTLPMSPRFASDERLRERQQKRAAQPKSPESKLATGKSQQAQKNTSRIPINASCNRSHVEEHKTTVTQPFSSSFEARQKEILRKKEDKIKQELERANKIPEFHANPVPKFSGKLPKKKLVEATHVEPFRLKSDERGAAYQEAFKQKLEEEEQHQKEQTLFHAQSADVIHKAPFEPERPTRFIEPQAFNLATVKRAAEREQYDEQLREREREDEESRREEQQKLEELQKLEDIERRRQLVHKAQPFKAPKPFQLKASAKPLTMPQSPAFSALPSERRIVKPHNSTLTQ